MHASSECGAGWSSSWLGDCALRRAVMIAASWALALPGGGRYLWKAGNEHWRWAPLVRVRAWRDAHTSWRCLGTWTSGWG
jgi:hypothetical protein